MSFFSSVCASSSDDNLNYFPPVKDFSAPSGGENQRDLFKLQNSEMMTFRNYCVVINKHFNFYRIKQKTVCGESGRV